MENILVTGGAGYIGSHTCKALRLQGYNPVVLDSLVTGHEYAVRWGPFCRVDLLDYNAVISVFEKYQPSKVIHFASFAYVGESVLDPEKYYQNNLIGTLNLLKAMRKSNCRHLIFSSTCATYGIPHQLPILETSEQNPINPYGRSKWMIEQILKDYGTAYGFRSLCLRYFNASGSDADGELGEDHESEPHLIPNILFAAQDPSRSVSIFGDDYETPDGTAIRDYIHVSDLAEAHVLGLQYIQNSNDLVDAINLGTGTGHSVKELVSAAIQVTGRSIKVQIAPRRSGDPAVLVADPSKAKRLLEWEPKFPDISIQIKHAWNWMESRSRLMNDKFQQRVCDRV